MPDLPSPTDNPNAAVVIFDGNCKFCTRQVGNLRKLDGKNRLAFVSLHDPFVKENFPDMDHDKLMEQMYVIPSGRSGYSSQRFGGAAAGRYLSRHLPLLWILAPLLHIPFSLPVWQWLYMQIAKRRYRIAGKTGDNCDPDGSCELHFKK